MKTWLLALGALATALTVSAPAATAANFYYYLPLPAAVGADEAEVYTPYVFQAHAGLAGAALRDAALQEVRKALPRELAAITVKGAGSSADLAVAADQTQDPTITDRALGAVYFTLRVAGVQRVTLQGRPLDGAYFSRPAVVLVAPLQAALPPRQIGFGFVRYGDTVAPVDTFYQRLQAGDTAIRDAALKLLQSASTPVKLALLGSLPALHMRDVTQAILPRLTDGDLTVRLKALELLKGYKSGNVLTALADVVDRDPSPDAKLGAVRILVAAGQSKFKKYLLLEDLKSPDAAKVVDAAKGLIATGDPKFATSFEGLVRHADPAVRAVGVKGLQSFKRYAVMAALLDDAKVAQDVNVAGARILADEDQGARQAKGLGWLLAKGPEPQALHAAEVAGAKHVPGTTRALGGALKRPEKTVRLAASKALASLKDPAGLEPLAAAVRNAGADDEREAMTADAISIIAVQPLSQVIKISQSSDVTVRELALKSLAEFAKKKPNPKVVAVLTDRISDSEPSIRRAAVFALARIHDPKVARTLFGLKDDKDDAIRAQVALSLGSSKDPKAANMLLGYLDDPSNKVKEIAVKAIRERKLLAAMPKLKNLVDYRHDGVRVEVVRAIAAMSKPGDPAIFDMWAQKIYDKSPAVRILAIDQLAAYPHDPRSAITIGSGVTDQDKGVKLHALKILSKSQDVNAVEQVIRGLFDDDVDVKMAALDALAALKSPKAMKALTEFISNEGDASLKKRATEVLDTL